MATEETAIVHEIMVDATKHGARLLKNVRGSFYTIDSVKRLIAAITTGDVRKAIKELRIVAAGLLAPGASDLIGATPVVITQDMVGSTIAVFTAIECKTATGRASPEQLNFIEFVRKIGGFAGVARNKEDARKIMRISA